MVQQVEGVEFFQAIINPFQYSISERKLAPSLFDVQLHRDIASCGFVIRASHFRFLDEPFGIEFRNVRHANIHRHAQTVSTSLGRTDTNLGVNRNLPGLNMETSSRFDVSL